MATAMASVTKAARTSRLSGLRATPLMALAGVVVLAAVAFLGHLVLAQRAHILARAQAARAVAAKNTAIYDRGLYVEHHAAAFRAKLAAYQRAIPATENLSALIGDIDAAAASSGVTWTNGSPQAVAAASTTTGPGAKPAAAAATTGVSVSFTGPLSSQIAFISALQHMPRLAVVTGASLSPGGTAPSGSATIDIFFAGR